MIIDPYYNSVFTTVVFHQFEIDNATVDPVMCICLKKYPSAIFQIYFGEKTDIQAHKALSHVSCSLIWDIYNLPYVLSIRLYIHQT